MASLKLISSDAIFNVQLSTFYTQYVSFSKEILSFRSTFRYIREKSYSIAERADLLNIKNHFISSSFPEVYTAFLLLVTIPVTTASAKQSFSKLKLIKTYLRWEKKGYAT